MMGIRMVGWDMILIKRKDFGMGMVYVLVCCSPDMSAWWLGSPLGSSCGQRVCILV